MEHMLCLHRLATHVLQLWTLAGLSVSVCILHRLPHGKQQSLIFFWLSNSFSDYYFRLEVFEEIMMSQLFPSWIACLCVISLLRWLSPSHAFWRNDTAVHQGWSNNFLVEGISKHEHIICLGGKTSKHHKNIISL